MDKIKNCGLTQADLWTIAELIIKLQKESALIPRDIKDTIEWDSLEEDWFDWLEDELAPKPEPFLPALKWQRQLLDVTWVDIDDSQADSFYKVRRVSK